MNSIIRYFLGVLDAVYLYFYTFYYPCQNLLKGLNGSLTFSSLDGGKNLQNLHTKLEIINNKILLNTIHSVKLPNLCYPTGGIEGGSSDKVPQASQSCW